MRKTKAIRFTAAAYMLLAAVHFALAAGSAQYLTVENGVLTGCKKTASGDLIIPDGVTAILPGAFQDCLALTSITMPATVTVIGKGVFDGCYSFVNSF